MTTMDYSYFVCLPEISQDIDVKKRLKFQGDEDFTHDTYKRLVCNPPGDVIDGYRREVKRVKISHTVEEDESEPKSHDETESELNGAGVSVGIKTSRREVIERVLELGGESVGTLREKHGPNGVNSLMDSTAKYCHEIKSLFTRVRTQRDDEHLSRLCAEMKRLEKLYLIVGFNNTKLCFDAIPADNLKTIIIALNKCENPSIELLSGQKKLISRCSPSLLTYLSIDYVDDECLKIVGQMINLKFLKLRFSYAKGVTWRGGLCHILNLKKLKDLKLEAGEKWTSVINDFIMAPSKNLPLLATTTTMNDLDNDCLREIFSYIDVKERIQFREVCSRFCDVIDDCWRGVDHVTISYAEEVDESRPQSDNGNITKLSGTGKNVEIKTSRREVIEKVLELCGESVRTLVERYGKGVNSLTDCAAKYCPGITALSIQLRTQQDCEHLSRLCAEIKRLDKLCLAIGVDTKPCFEAIPADNLRIIYFVLGKSQNPPIDILRGQKKLMSRCSPSLLTDLTIDYFDDEYLKIVGQMINLEFLKLRFIYAKCVTRDGLNHILALKNLKVLKLRAARFKSPINDDFIISLSRNLPLLEELELLDNNSVTNEGFRSLASLTKLRKLLICNCEGITDDYLFLFSHLVELSFLTCYNVSDTGVIKLLEKAETMQSLRLDYTGITRRTLEAAVKATMTMKRMINWIPLTLYVTFDPADLCQEVPKNSPLLTIILNSKLTFNS